MPEHQKFAEQLHHYVREILNEISTGLSSPGSEIVTVTHTLRKGLKRVRALAKLIRHKHSAEVYERVNKLLRDWGRFFSELRDSHVRNLVINQLKDLSDFQSIQSELNLLSDINQKETAVLEKNLLHQNNKFFWLKKEIEKNTEIEQYFTVENLNKKDLNTGLESSFSKSSDTFCIVKKHNAPENLHEWRKRLKDVQYQLELSDLINLSKSTEKTDLTAKINENLGTDQDYFNLMIWVMYHKEKFSIPSHYSTFMKQIKQMRADQQKAAFENASLLYNL